MKKSWMLLCLHIKASFKAVPKLLLGTFCLTFVVVLMSVGLNYAMKDNGNAEMLRVAVVLPQDDSDQYVKKAFEFLGDMDNVKSVCRFVMKDEDTAIRGLKDGTYAAVVMIPENFINDIIYGKNTPAKIIFPGQGVNNTSMLFREMINAGGSDLSTAEAAIYASEEVLTKITGGRAYIDKVDNDLTATFFSYAWDRGLYFEVTDLSQKHGLSTIQFYSCTAVIMLLLLSGITCAGILKKDKAVVITALKRAGIHFWENGAYKVIGVTLVYTCIGAFVLIFGALASIRYPVIRNVITINGIKDMTVAILGLIVLIFSVFSFIYFVYEIVGNVVYSILTIFLVGVVEMYASGCFIPTSLLPGMVRNIGNFLPAKYYFELAGQAITGQFQGMAMFVSIVFSAAFILVAAKLSLHRRNV